MKDKLDLDIKTELTDSKPQIPDGYYEKVRKNLEKLENTRTNRTKSIGMLRIACTLAIFLVVGVGTTYAAINYKNERLSEMKADEIFAYNEEVQNAEVDTDSFSRELSEEERARLEKLKKDYEQKGVFPKNSISKVESKAEINGKELFFCISESKFYLPDRMMSDEELLEIIDFYIKRDFSLESTTAEKTENFNQNLETESLIVKAAKQNIEEFFEVDMEDEYHIEYGEITDQVMFDLDEGNAMILLDAQEHTMNEMRLNIDGMYAEGMKFEQFDYDEVYKILKEKLCKLSEKNISAAKVMYVELQNGELYHGMVRYIFELEDGSGYVINYSLNLQREYYLRYFDRIKSYEDYVDKDSVEVDLENEQRCTSTEIDTSESTSIRVHPVTGEIRVEDESETFITDENFLMKNNNSEEQEATVMCTEITVQNDITRIVVTNGNTGEKKEINSIEEVDSILDQIRSMTVISCEKGNVQGYSYFLALYRNEDFVQSVYVSSESIQTDGIRYMVESTKDLSDNIVD